MTSLEFSPVGRPMPLQRGDAVRIVAPASAITDRSAFDRGVQVLKSWGLEPEWSPGIFSLHQMWAGDDSFRSADLASAFGDDRMRAVFCARGGYGTTRLLSLMKPERWSRKWWIGFSDATAIHAQCPFPSLLAPNVVTLGDVPSEDAEALRRVLFSESQDWLTLKGDAVGRHPVQACGVGGNLSVLCCLIGTPHMPSLAGKLVFLEDWHERTYRLDRMWQHLLAATDVRLAAGFALGQFIEETGDPWSPGAWMKEECERLGKPLICNLPFGHGLRHVPIPLGIPLTLDPAAGRLFS